MGRLTDRLFWTEENQTRTDEHWRQVREERSNRNVAKNWAYAVAGAGSFLALTAILGLLGADKNAMWLISYGIVVLVFSGIKFVQRRRRRNEP